MAFRNDLLKQPFIDQFGAVPGTVSTTLTTFSASGLPSYVVTIPSAGTYLLRVDLGLVALGAGNDLAAFQLQATGASGTPISNLSLRLSVYGDGRIYPYSFAAPITFTSVGPQTISIDWHATFGQGIQANGATYVEYTLTRGTT